jgi:putative transposase
MRIAFKYRLYPNANQARELVQQLETHRRLYNQALALRIAQYKEHCACQHFGLPSRSLTFYDQTRWFKSENKINPWYGRISADAASATLDRLDKAYANFFRRLSERAAKVGFPRFKGAGRFTSINYPHAGGNNGIGLKDNRLRVKHVGLIKAKIHRPVEGKIKTASLKLEGNKWFVVFSCDLGEQEIAPSTAAPIGIDVGIESFAVTSDGESIANPSWLKQELPELRRRGRAVSRKRKGGANRRKAVRRLRACHVRVANLRREQHHQLSNRLVRRYGLIAVESLNVKGMVRNHRIAQAISDAGWSAFLGAVRYKAERAGVTFVEVNPQNTSQICSGCGELVPKTLSQRQHNCPHCGLVLHRDHNAAKNILARALEARTGPAGRKAKGSSAPVPRTRTSQVRMCRDATSR